MPKRYTHQDIDLGGKNVAELIERKAAIAEALKYRRDQVDHHSRERDRLWSLLVKNNEALERFTDRYEVKG